jgi:hypothetical protein
MYKSARLLACVFFKVYRDNRIRYCLGAGLSADCLQEQTCSNAI